MTEVKNLVLRFIISYIFKALLVVINLNYQKINDQNLRGGGSKKYSKIFTNGYPLNRNIIEEIFVNNRSTISKNIYDMTFV